MSEPHKVVELEVVPPVLTGDEKRCPRCLSKWEGDPIPENIRQYYGDKTHWSKLIGVEVPGVYDGVLLWECPACKTKFPRFDWAQKYCKKA